jgi:hypothetical protein
MAHWMFRVKDGRNFRNSKYLFWGVKRGNGGVKTIVQRFQPGDVLWFITSAKYGGQAIAVAEYTCMYDRKDEPLLQIHTYTNAEQGWDGEDEWDIQIHYKHLHNIEQYKIPISIQCAGAILQYDTFKCKIPEDLHSRYEQIKSNPT